MIRERDMTECAMAPALRALCRVRRFHKYVMWLALRSEGDRFYSRTARWLLKEHYGVSVGDYSYGNMFKCGVLPPGVTIGRYASVGPGVQVFTHNHPMNRLSTHPFFYNPVFGFVTEDEFVDGKLEIGHDSWIGANVVILAGCRRIGIGAVVGAGSIVTHDIPDFAVAIGSPARVVRMRFPAETCERIRASRWWEKPVGEVVRHLKDMRCALEKNELTHPLLITEGTREVSKI